MKDSDRTLLLVSALVAAIVAAGVSLLTPDPIADAADAQVAGLADCLDAAGRRLAAGDAAQADEWLRCLQAGTWDPVRVLGRAPAVDAVLASHTPRLDALVDGAIGAEHSHAGGEGHGHLLAGDTATLAALGAVYTSAARELRGLEW